MIFATRAYGASSEYTSYSGYVVKIISDINGQPQKPEIGTGFFWGAADQVVTAYHVIRNSKRIQILYGNERYEDVTVVSVSGEYDLAILKIRGIKQTTYFYKENYDINLPYEGIDVKSNLIAPCYPRNSINPQVLHARLTSDVTQNSFTFHDQKGRNIFRVRMDVISIEAIIYGGASGAPLLFGTAPIGVISGSLNEGGTLAWAIPLSYLKETQPIGQTPQEIKLWPILTIVYDDVYRSLSVERLKPGTNHYWDISIGKQLLDFDSTAIDFPSLDWNLFAAIAYTVNLYEVSSWGSVELALHLLDYSFSYQTLEGIETTVAHAFGVMPLVSGFFCYTFYQRTNLEPFLGVGLGLATIVPFSNSNTVGAFKRIFPVVPQVRLGLAVYNRLFLEMRVLFTSFAVNHVSFNNFGQGNLFEAWDWQIRLHLDMGLRL